MHLTVGIFGDTDLLKSLGKQGTMNDIAIHNHASSDGVFTFVSPNSPENKIQPIFQTLNMVDIPVISGELTKELAEQMIAIDSFGFSRGFLVSPSDDILNIIKGTSIEKFDIVQGERELREKLVNIEPVPISKEPWLPIDNYFTVKSVGTVVLSVNKGCSIKKYDKLTIQPTGKEVLVKGIQSQDKDLDEALVGMRVGLSIKGVDADKINRGNVICREASVSKEVKIKFKKSIFSNQTIKKGMRYHFSVGLQVIECEVVGVSGDEVTVELSQPAVFFSGQKCLLAITSNTMPRIVGSGVVL